MQLACLQTEDIHCWLLAGTPKDHQTNAAFLCEPTLVWNARTGSALASELVKQDAHLATCMLQKCAMPRV